MGFAWGKFGNPVNSSPIAEPPAHAPRLRFMFVRMSNIGQKVTTAVYHQASGELLHVPIDLPAVFDAWAWIGR